MDRLLVGCAAISAVGLALLGILAYGLAPRPTPIADLAQREGQRACVEATLAQLRPTGSAGARILLADEEASVSGRTPDRPALVPGDRVLACGTVERTAGGLELAPRRPDDLTRLQAWDERATPLALVAAEPWRYLDQHLVVWGTPTKDGLRWHLDDGAGARIRLASTEGLGLGEPGPFAGVPEYDADDSTFRFRLLPPGVAA